MLGDRLRRPLVYDAPTRDAGFFTESLDTRDPELFDSIADELYWLALGRPPTEGERLHCHRYLSAGGTWSELAQALVVSNEFLFVD